MLAGHDLCHAADVHTRRLMHEGLGLRCMSLADVTCQMCTCHVRYVQALADAACRWPTLMSPSHCTYAMADTCWPCLMQPVVGRCRLPDTQMPRPMRAGLG